MKPYELVLVIKASLGADEKTELLSTVEDIIGKDTIKAKDDIGVVKTAYSLQGKKENTHMHLVSYYIHTDPVAINNFTKQFTFVKGLLRHFFYAMKANEEFVTYADMQKKVEKILSDKEEKKPSKK
ncbi:30S ribosomal protein S6 [candidate division SR1 bacterium Aalborg_AAW-1]|nr:30S ribosomal protein S6 [candidate division SR1 bacterium Aalborg_AAW-1]